MCQIKRLRWDRTILSFLLIVAFTNGTNTEDQSYRCDLSLGMEKGEIPITAISTSLPSSSVSGIRLNSNSAWCYNVSSLPLGARVTLTIDLGRMAFVSAVQTQGPPASLHGPEYVNYNPFRLYNSSKSSADGPIPDDKWELCCGDTKYFYAEDKHAEVDVISTHAFGLLVLARSLKLEFESGLNTGDRKCYRIEVLGCPSGLTPHTNLTISALPAGYLQTTWLASTVVLPTVSGTEVFPLMTPEYKVVTDRWGTTLPNMTTVQHVEVARVLLPNPVWGAQYRVQMTCIHQGVALPCGTAQLTALLPGCSPCQPGEGLVFRRPQPLRGAVVQDGAPSLQGALVLWWEATGGGWITPTVTLTVKNKAQQLMSIETIDTNRTYAIVKGLQKGETYSVEFTPVTKLQNPPIFTYPLYLIQWSNVISTSADSGFGAFLADLSLEANVLWNGTLRVTWTPGIVRGTLEVPTTATTVMTSASSPISTVPAASTTSVTSTTSATSTTPTASATSTTSTTSATSTTPTTSATSTTSTTAATSTTSTISGTSATSTTSTTSATSTNSATSATSNTSSTSAVPATATTFTSTTSAVSTRVTTSSSSVPSSNTSTAQNSTGTTTITTARTTLTTSAGSTSSAASSSQSSTSTNSTLNIASSISTSPSTSASTSSTPLTPSTSTVPPRRSVTSALATSYNITLLQNGTVVNYAVVQSNVTELRVDFPLLSLLTEYTVEMKCYLGSLEVNCSNVRTVTSLPLSWTEVGNELKVYMGQDSGDSWYEQRQKCLRSSSLLVSLATRTEEMLFMEAMKLRDSKTYSEFWLGSSFCQDNGGKLWEDGSPWSFSRLPTINSGISSSTCCVKVVKTSAADEPYAYKWRGEQCGAILPAVCEHTPPGLVGSIKSINRTRANITSASVTFTYTPQYWQATYINVSYAPTIDLETNLPLHNQSRTDMLLDNSSKSCTAAGLLVFTEYLVSASAVLQPLGYSGRSANITVRTYPAKPVSVSILSSGRVAYKWSQKIAEFGDNDSISVKLVGGLSSSPDASLPPTEVKSLASGGMIGPLRIGRKYHLIMKEVAGVSGAEPRNETFNFTAYPPCDCQDCQLGQQCYVVTPNKVSAAAASASCSAFSTRVTATKYKTTLALLINIAQKVGDDLWVSSDSEMGIGLDEASVQVKGSLTLESEAEVVGSATTASSNSSKTTTSVPITTTTTTIKTTTSTTTTTTTRLPTTSDGLCKLVSRAAREVVKRPCTELHFASCVYQAKIASVFPPVQEIAIETGDSWVKLNWNASITGWSANYSVEFWRSRDHRVKRQTQDVNFISPPVTIDGLQANMPYSMSLVAALGDDYYSSTPEFKVITGRQASGYLQPLGVAGVGWSHTSDVFLLQLLASSLLVTACIATMLLFFSTGMFYQDCMAQLGFLTCLMVAFLVLVLAHASVVLSYDESGCTVLAVVLHALFLGAFMFLTLESHAISFLLVGPISNPFQKSNWLMVLMGVMIPSVFCLVTGGIINVKYADVVNQNCWLLPTGPAVYVEAIPKFILLVATLALLVMTFTTTGELPDLVELEDLRGRQSDGRKLRWVIGAEALLLALVWATGVAAYHTKNDALHVVFAVATLVLAIVILFFRTYMDETFRSKWHRLCCGTELTYKRSDLVGLSARNRISPHIIDPRGHSSKSSSAQTMSYNLPHTPPQDDDRQVLVRRTYNFDH
ncbi:mucin-17 [Hyalella azteca]|uniref:Mucin-17 n=1 Tax=Hyalella azteca TaxID=294128 RepID=A0A8B7NS82_HYAAZ|nr:mucin-17 [Hyalella azteca]